LSKRWQDLAILAVLFISLRFFALFLFRVGGFITDFSDFNVSFLTFARWSRYGLYPYLDFWMEYPPLLPWMVIALYRVSLLLPPWHDSPLWFNALMGLTVLTFDVGNLVLLYLIGCRLWGWERGRFVGWIYLGLFAPFYTAMGWLDNIPLFFMLLSLWLWIELPPGRRLLSAIASGASLGVGFMFKIIPALLLPLGLKVLKGKGFAICLAVFLIVVSFIATPFMLQSPEIFITSFRAMLGRSPWETVWALVNGYYSYGVIAGDRFSVPESFALYHSRIPGMFSIILWGLIYLWLLLRRDQGGEPAYAVTAASLIFFSYELFTTGYSPQHIVYFLPFLLLTMPNLTGTVGAISLTLVNLFEAVGYFVMFPQERWLLVMAVILRTLGLFTLCLTTALKLIGGNLQLGLWILRAWASFALLCFVVATPLLGKVYIRDRLAITPCADLINKLQDYGAGTDVIFLSGETHDAIYPYLKRDLHISLLPELPLAFKSLEEERLAFFQRKDIKGKFLVIFNPAEPAEIEALDWLEKTFGPGVNVLNAGGCILMEFKRNEEN